MYLSHGGMYSAHYFGKICITSNQCCSVESEEFNAVKYCAPFVLIGDDVNLNFGQEKIRPSLYML